MNRRSFIAGILAACVAPKVLLPKLKDHARWRVTRSNGLYVAQMRFNEMEFAGKWQWVVDSVEPTISPRYRYA